MKILKISFSNLNSLKGKFSIDFTNKNYVDNGIFAITGPTGAGKSTILDAICLALYSKTPRLSDITNGSNEIMTRSEGECYSSVIFETKGKYYEAKFAQHRSRKQMQGALQGKKHTLLELNQDRLSGSIIADGKQTLSKVIEVTGLDFDNFSKALMLSQGNFASFLKSSEADRASLLEKLTGTEFYSKISAFVFRETQDKRIALNSIQDKLDDFTILSQDDEKAINTRLFEIKNSKEKFNVDIDAINANLKLVASYKDSLKDYENAKLKKLELDNAMDLFKVKDQDILDYEKALSLNDDYIDYESTKKDINNLFAFKAQAMFLKKHFEHSINLKKDSLLKIEMNLSQNRQIYDNTSKIAPDVILLDKSHEDLINNINKAKLNKKDKTDIYNAKDHDLLDINKKLSASQQKLDLCKKYKNEHKDDYLLKDLIENNRPLLLNIKNNNVPDLNTKINEFLSIFNIYKDARDKKESIDAKLCSKQDEILAIKDNLVRLNLSIENITKNGDSFYLQSTISDLNEIKSYIKSIFNTLQEKVLIIDKLGKKILDKDKTEKDLKDAKDEVLSIKLKIDALNTAISARQAAFDAEMQIKNFDDLRKNLEKDKPCPLCGSCDHPYVEHTILYENLDRKKIEIMQQDLQNLQDKRTTSLALEQSLQRSLDGFDETFNELHVKNTKCNDELLQSLCELFKLIDTSKGFDGFLNNTDEHSKDIFLCIKGWSENSFAFKQEQTLEKDSNSYAEALNSFIATILKPSDNLDIKSVDKAINLYIDAKKADLNTIESLLKEKKEHENNISIINASLDTLKQSHEKALINVSLNHDKAIGLINEIEKHQGLILNNLTKIKENIVSCYSKDALKNLVVFDILDINALLKSLNIDESLYDKDKSFIDIFYKNKNALESLKKSFDTSFDAINQNIYVFDITLKNFKLLNDKYINTQKDIDLYTKDVESLNNDKIRLNSELLSCQKEILNIDNEIKAFITSLNEIKTKRNELFKGDDINIYLELLKKDLDAKQCVFDKENTDLLKTVNTKDTLVSQVMSLVKAKVSKDLILKTKRESLLEKIKALGFNSIDIFVSKLLLKDSYKALKAQKDNLITSLNECKGRLNNIKESLDKLQIKGVERLDEIKLKESLLDMRTNLDKLSIEEGSLLEKINVNNERKKSKDSLYKEYKSQLDTLSRYQRLCDLMGTADGKKYRKFVQGISLEFLVSIANEKLNTLTDRYKLVVAGENGSLNICVIDLYQFSQIRPTDNLSGGESFLVSLALSLALSHIASQNVMVDSLFLDEGFGTLDDETLDCALDALAMLERQGKLIGIISHVAKLKDRIKTQIEVIKLSGGISTIKGPGCVTDI